MKTKTKTSDLTIDLTATTFPVCRFEYPDSKTNNMKIRFVRVTEANDEYVKGYELEYPNSQKGKFKQYRRQRIARDGVALLIF